MRLKIEVVQLGKYVKRIWRQIFMFGLLNNWSIRLKLFISTAFILIVSFAILGYQQANNVISIIEGEALEKARSDLQMGMAVIDYKYPGEWKLEGENLFKGPVLMNNNFEIVDLIGELTNGNTATLFARDTSITSNGMVEGDRGIGTKVTQEVVDQVLGEGKVFHKKTDELGHTHQTVYAPIKDENSEIIGMWHIGAPDASARIQEIKSATALSVFILTVLILVVSLIIYFLLTRPIINRIKLASTSLVRVADGDLSFKLQKPASNDETAILLNAVNGMTAQLKFLLDQSKKVSMQVASSSEQLTASTYENTRAVEQITASSEAVVKGEKEQLKNVEEAVCIVANMSDEIDQSIIRSEEMAILALDVSAASSKGMEAIGNVLNHMQEIDSNVVETSIIIKKLNERSHEINDIISIITGIASQTNLLALNAAIESARAGEMGKGFAVVADEVRKLAEQSSQSSERIAHLIIEIQRETEEAVNSMTIGTDKTKAGMIETEQANNMFIQVNESIADVTPKTAEVSRYIQEMAKQSKHLVQLIEMIGTKANDGIIISQQNNTATEEQLAMMEEISASAINLSQLSEVMTQTFEKFKTD